MDVKKLEKLNELREKGVITQDEFNEEILFDNNLGNKQKKQSVFLWLAFFLGFIGIHNFYVGQKRNGIIKLLVYLLYSCIDAEKVWEASLCGITFGLPVYIWIIIEMFNTNKTSSGADLIPTTKIFRNTLAGIYCGLVAIGYLCNLLILTSNLLSISYYQH